MPNKKEAAGDAAHIAPADIKKALALDTLALDAWNSLTPIQRNEWICWVIIVKKPETRAEHIVRMVAELKEGVRQPCCWPGCPHRRPKAKKWFKNDFHVVVKSSQIKKTKTICSRGHIFVKNKDVPTCPVCWPGRYKSKKTNL